MKVKLSTKLETILFVVKETKLIIYWCMSVQHFIMDIFIILSINVILIPRQQQSILLLSGYIIFYLTIFCFQLFFYKAFTCFSSVSLTWENQDF